MEGPVKQRDVVVIPFPFSDGRNAKRRPAMVASNNAYNRAGQDVLVFAITRSKSSASLTVRMEDGQLQKGSQVRADAPLRIDKSLIRGRIGTVTADTHELAVQRLLQLVR